MQKNQGAAMKPHLVLEVDQVHSGSLSLKAVAQTELHDSWTALNAVEGPPIRSGRIYLGINLQLLIRRVAKMLRVGHIERFRTQLQLMIFAPRHFERFSEAEIERNVTWQPYHISVSGLAGFGIPPTLVSLCRI